jgi:alkanesulfonate monooxygenase SsuD/methylene tetrahydromethanopterin reductase-like flavin-dependent oxidoreductase (luciferase family)
MDRDLETYRDIWRGEPVGGGPNPAVPPGTRQIPMLFGGFAPAVMDRMARWGDGYIGGSVPAPMAAPAFDAARDAWRRAGREGAPRLVALAYFALGGSDKGRQNVYDFYSVVSGEFAGIVARAVCGSPAKVREKISSFADIGVDEISFNPGTDDLDEVKRLADIVF